MGLLDRISDELRVVFQSKAVASRIATGVAVLLGVAVVFGLVTRSSSRNLVPLLDESEFNSSELAALQAELTEAGIPQPEMRDGQLLVPAAELDRYRNVIRTVVDAPHTWAETWEEANSALSHFSMSAERDDIKEIARAKLTSRLLNELPGVDQADVVWDEEQQPGWNRPPLVRATVYLKPREGHRITLETVHAVRLAVAGSKAYLNPDNVVVMDLSRMVAFDRAALGADFDAQYGQITRLTTEYRTRAEAAVSDIPGALLAVAVESTTGSSYEHTTRFSPPPQSEPESTLTRSEPDDGMLQGGPNVGLEIPREPFLVGSVVASELPADTVTPTTGEIESPSPGSRFQVNVSVSIPTAHYHQIGASRNLLPAATPEAASQTLAEIEQEVIASVHSRLAQLDPQSERVVSQPVVVVESVELAEIPDELLVQSPTLPPRQPLSATLLGKSRTVLIAVTLLMTCWLGWLVFRMLTRRSTGERSEAMPAAPHESAPRSGVATREQEDLLPSEDVPPEFVSEILNAGDGEVLEKRFPQPTSPSAGVAVNEQAELPTAAGGNLERPRTMNQVNSPDADQWDIDDLAELPDEQLRQLVHSVAIDMWPAALSSASQSTRRRLLSALSDGEANELRSILDQVRPMRLAEIDLARQEVLSALAAG